MGNLEENLKETNNNQVQLLEKEKTEEKNTEIEEPEIVEESTEPEVTAEPAAAQETVTEPEKKGNTALVVGAGVAVLAVCGIGGGVVYSRKKKG